MASFTDIIPQFNPYIQQLPVDAMVKVGMAKQQMYEQNVTKIQSEMDRIAGLAIARPADKEYLQSKLNQLGNKLTLLAGADFSNFQVANSVSGMTKQIAKDQTVQSAVRATAKAQQEEQKIENGKSDGTWSVENEDLYRNQYQKWYNSKTPGEALNAEYVPYRDVYKKLRGIAKDVGVDESLVQNLFNPDGTVNKVMVETYSKGKDPNKIYEAFVTGLDQSDYRQLAITGRYKYKGYSANQLIDILKTSNDEYTQLANGRKLDIEQRIKKIDQLLPTLKKPEEKKILEDQKGKLLQAVSKLDDQITESNNTFNDSRTKLSSGDEAAADGVRARIHTNNFLSTLSRDFADKSSYVKYDENPLWQAIMDEEKFKLDKWYKEQSIDVEKRKAAAAEKANKIKEEEIIAYSTPGAMGGGAIPTKENIETSYNGFVNERQGLYNTLALSAFGNNSAKLEAYVKTAISGGKKTRDAVLAELGVQEYTKLANIINDKTGKSGNATKINPVLLEAVSNIARLNTTVSNMKASMEQIERDAYIELGMTKEQLNKKKEPSFWKTSKMIIGLGLGNPLLGGRGASIAANQKTEEVKKFEKIVDRKYSEVFSGFFPQNLGFVMNDKNRAPILSKLNTALYQNPLYTEEVRKSLLENNSQVMLSAIPSKTGYGGTTYAAVITSKDGKQSEPIPITSEQYTFLSGSSAPTTDIETVSVRARVNSSPDNSTNMKGVGNWTTSYVPGKMFTNIKGYNIGGMDLIQSKNSQDAFYPVLYVAPAGTSNYQTIPIQRSGTLSEGLSIPSLITDSQLKAMGVNF